MEHRALLIGASWQPQACFTSSALGGADGADGVDGVDGADGEPAPVPSSVGKICRAQTTGAFYEFAALPVATV